MIAGYGAWPSPIAATALTRAVVGLDRGVVDGDRVYWTEARPEEGGRVSLWCRDGGTEPVEVSGGHNVRNSINEYGGGAWTAADGLVVYSHGPTAELFVFEAGRTRRLAGQPGLRYGSLSLVPGRRLVLAVREDHREPGPCLQTVVALDLDSGNGDGGRVLAAGADFYASPTASTGGKLAWVQWWLPQMPWDGTELMVSGLDQPAEAVRVAGGPKVSAVYPSWADDDTLVFLADDSGYWNFRRWDGADVHALNAHRFDFCLPMWTPDPAPYTLLPDGRIGCSWLDDGLGCFGLLDPAAGGQLAQLASEAVTVSFSGRGQQVVALLGYPGRPAELVRLDLGTGEQALLRRAAETDLAPGMVSRAQPVTWASPDGPVHGWFYPPTNADATAPTGELPPVQVWCHGGPTGIATPEFRLGIQFWTSRGIGILEVNYAGSAGFGRAYRERLAGAWGVSDVRDCVAGAVALVDAGLADPARLSIRGSSAGGFTALAALTSTDLFAAGVSLYGVADLESLTGDSHKFESRYLDGLVAPYPEQRQTYRERSPIHRVDRLRRPLLLLQGRNDTVVPPEQAQALAEAAAARGLPVALHWFDEGHGFRSAESIIAAAEAALAFLGKVHGFTPA